MPDLSNYVQMDEKTTMNSKIIHYQDIYENCIYWHIRFLFYGGDILSFHFFEAVNDIFEV